MTNEQQRGPGRPRIHQQPREQISVLLPTALLDRLAMHTTRGQRNEWIAAAIQQRVTEPRPAFDGQQPIKQVSIGSKTIHREGHYGGHDVLVYVVLVRVFGDDGAECDCHEQWYDALAEAQAYAAEVMTRDLRPFSLAHLLDPR